MDINLAMKLANSKSKEQFKITMAKGGVKVTGTEPMNKTQSNVNFSSVSSGEFCFEVLINNVCIKG